MIPFELGDALAQLARTPMVLHALLAGLPDRWSRQNEGGESFSPFDVVGHLIDGEETDWILRATIIRAGDPSKQFAPYDRFRHRSRNVGRTLDSLLDEFAALRTANLETVRAWQLTDTDLGMTATHPVFGAVTLRQLLATWVTHDLGHLAQIARVLAKQNGAEVGPWQEFLPILRDREPQP